MTRMATQRLTVAGLAWSAAMAVGGFFGAQRADPDHDAVDRFCAALRDNALSLSVVYFCEWVDRWLMGDTVPGPNEIEGRRYQATCLSPEQAVAWAGRCGRQFQEQEWLAARLREAAATWQSDAVIVVREVTGPSATVDEIRVALSSVPVWLAWAGSPI